MQQIDRVSNTMQIRCLEKVNDRELKELVDVLIDCVENGASVGFLSPIERAKAEKFWRNIFSSVACGERIVLVAENAIGTIIGTVQLILAQPENQPHRGEISKMLVHRHARQQGVGTALLVAAERNAVNVGKTLLVLDTASVEAKRLYIQQGWQCCGEIPNFALMPDGKTCATSIYFKCLKK